MVLSGPLPPTPGGKGSGREDEAAGDPRGTCPHPASAGTLPWASPSPPGRGEAGTRRWQDGWAGRSQPSTRHCKRKRQSAPQSRPGKLCSWSEHKGLFRACSQGAQ